MSSTRRRAAAEHAAVRQLPARAEPAARHAAAAPTRRRRRSRPARARRGRAAGHARRRERGPHVQRGDPVHRRRVQLPARGRRRAAPDAQTRYSNTLANLGDLGGRARRSRAVNPSALPRGHDARRRARPAPSTSFGSREHGRGRRHGRVGAASTQRAVADAHRRAADGRGGRRARLPRRDREHDRGDGSIERRRASARCRWSSAPAAPGGPVGHAARRRRRLDAGRHDLRRR